MLLFVTLMASIAVRQATLGAHAKQFRRSEMDGNGRSGMRNSSISMSGQSKIGNLAVER